MVEIARGEVAQLGAVQLYGIYVFEIGVQALFPAAGGEIECAGCLVYAQDLFHVPGAGGDGVLFMALVVIQVKMPPPGLLGPVDQLFPIVYQEQGTRFHVGVQPFLDKGYGRIFIDFCVAQVNALEVPAGAVEVKARGITQPFGVAEFVRHFPFFHGFIAKVQ